MIDIEKMKALEQRLRDRHAYVWSMTSPRYRDEAAKLDEAAADAIESLLSELEAREADRRDAERYRWLRELDPEFWEVNRMSNMARFYGETLDAEIDAARAPASEGEQNADKA